MAKDSDASSDSDEDEKDSDEEDECSFDSGGESEDIGICQVMDGSMMELNGKGFNASLVSIKGEV